MIKLEHVAGEDRGKIVVYALSTCAWCKRLKKTLNELKVAYDFVDVDQLKGADEKEAEKEVKHWNAKETYPTMILNNEKVFLGLDLEEIKQALGK